LHSIDNHKQKVLLNPRFHRIPKGEAARAGRKKTRNGSEVYQPKEVSKNDKIREEAEQRNQRGKIAFEQGLIRGEGLGKDQSAGNINTGGKSGRG